MNDQSKVNTYQQNKVSANTNSSAHAGNSNIDEKGQLFVESSMQTKEFDKGSKVSDSKQETGVTATSDVDHNSSTSCDPATNIAATSERKAYGDVELNKGLESQAKDGEGQ